MLTRNRKGAGTTRDPRKQAAFDTAVANKVGLAGWVMHGSPGQGQGTAAQKAAAKESSARAAMQARDLPQAQRLVGQAIDQRMQALTSRSPQATQGKTAAQKQSRNHQQAVGHLRGVQQAMGDVASSYFHETRKIDGTWPPKGRRTKR